MSRPRPASWTLSIGPLRPEISGHRAELAKELDAVIPFFAFLVDVRKIIYTTDAINSLNASVRRAIRSKGHFPNHKGTAKPIWLALRHITENWKNPPSHGTLPERNSPSSSVSVSL